MRAQQFPKVIIGNEALFPMCITCTPAGIHPEPGSHLRSQISGMETGQAQKASVQAYPVKVRCMEVAISVVYVMLGRSCSGHQQLLFSL